MTPEIVGLAGYAGSGKDALGAHLRARGWQRVAFADEVKAKARELGWDGNKDDAGRRLLQEVGMIARREDPCHWIRKAFALIRKERVVITDVRFPNEVHAIRERGGRVLRVVRGGVGPCNNHESETALDRVELDGTVWNISTEASLGVWATLVCDGLL